MADPIALPVNRSPKQTLHHVWAPKLNRTVVLAGRDELHLWVMLEAHPEVTRYCERPTWPDETEASPEPDFWALRNGHEVWLKLHECARSDAAVSPLTPSLPALDLIDATALSQHRVWIQNWLSLLPYLGPAGTLDLGALFTPVVQAVRHDTCIDDIEQLFPTTEPLLVRTTVIAALHRGLLLSDELQHKPWSRFTRVTRTPHRGPHAAQ